MIRFLRWLSLFVPPRGPTLGGVLPGLFLDLQVFLVLVVKFLPPRVGGYLTWVWVWGFTYQTHRGTLLAVRSWYRTLSWGPPRREDFSFREGPPRRGPRLGPPTQEVHPLGDLEWYTLENVFPPGGEPFQDSERLDSQQDSDPQQGQEPPTPGDDLWGVPEGVSREERPRVFFRGRHRRLRRKISSKKYTTPEDSPEELIFRPGRTDLARLVDPGDGPRVNDQDDLEEVLSFRGEPLWDWYFCRSAPSEITQGTYPGSYYGYLLLEHQRSWRADPAGTPTGWFARAAGGVPWLFRTRLRLWGPARFRYHKLRKKKFFRWVTRPSPRVGPRGVPRRGLRHRRDRFLAQARRLPRYRRWRFPGFKKFNFDTRKNRYHLFGNTRFTRWGLRHRALRLRWRIARAGPSGVVRSAREVPRQRYLPWSGLSVPGRVAPPTGVALAVALGVLLVGAAAAFHWGETFLHLGVQGPPWGVDFPIRPRGPVKVVATPWEGHPARGDYLEVAARGFPEWWTNFRDFSPRGVHSVNLDHSGWFNRAVAATPARVVHHGGQTWEDQPGVGGNFFVHQYYRRLLPYLMGYESYGLPQDHMWGFFTGSAGLDSRGEVFQEYWGVNLPSWGARSGRVGPAGDGDFLMWMWRPRMALVLLPGENLWQLPFKPELDEIFRWVDFYYNDFYPAGELYWKSLVEYGHPAVSNPSTWPLTNAFTYQAHREGFEKGLHGQFRRPEWTPGGIPELTWENLTRRVGWSQGSVFFWASPYNLGMQDHFPWGVHSSDYSGGDTLLENLTHWGPPRGSTWLAPPAGPTRVETPPGGWDWIFRGVGYLGGGLFLWGRSWAPGGPGRVLVEPTRRITRVVRVGRPGRTTRGANLHPGRGFPELNHPHRGGQLPTRLFYRVGVHPGTGMVAPTRRLMNPVGRPGRTTRVVSPRFRLGWERLKLLPEEFPRWRRKRPRRGPPGLVLPGRLRVGSQTPRVRPAHPGWSAPGGEFTRGVTRGVHLGRYTHAVGSFSLQRGGSPPVGPGYSVGWYLDQYDDKFEGQQGDDEFGHQLDSTPPWEDPHGVRYLSVRAGNLTRPAGAPVGASLPGWSPRGAPQVWSPTGGVFSDGETWGWPSPGGLGDYRAPRTGRRLARGGHPLETLSQEVHLAGCLFRSHGVDYPDDLDGLDLNPSGGYLLGGIPARRGGHLRGDPVPSGWTSPGGTPWGALTGEAPGRPTPVDPENTLLGGLTRGYLDAYTGFGLETELSVLLDRDSEDYFQEGEPHEELNEEVPRPRGADFPPWVVDLALEGCSPGVAPAGGVPEFFLPGGRTPREELRRYYRGWKKRLARPTGKKPTLFPRRRTPPGENNLPLREELSGYLPGGGFRGALVRAELDVLTSRGVQNLEVKDLGEESLRLWALTEVYLGDYPVGSHLDS